MISDTALIASSFIVAVGIALGGYLLSPARVTDACETQVKILMQGTGKDAVSGSIIEYCHVKKN